MAVKLKIKRGKKRWFTVVAPEAFNKVEAGEITAYEPKELPGRKVAVPQSALTASPKDSQKNIDLKIVDVLGEKAVTVPWKYSLQEAYVQRAARKYRTNIAQVIRFPAKDNKQVKVKLLVLGKNKLHRSIISAMVHLLEERAPKLFGEFNGFDLFVPGNFDKLANELKKELVKIYPIEKVVVWKVRV